MQDLYAQPYWAAQIDRGADGHARSVAASDLACNVCGTSRSLADQDARAFPPLIRRTRRGVRIVAAVVQVSSTSSRATTLASVRTGRGLRLPKLEPADLVGV